MSTNEDPGMLEKARELLHVGFDLKDTRISLFSRIWDSSDRKALLTYDVLAIASLFYVFSDEEERDEMEERLEEVLEIDDVRAAILFFLTSQINAPFEAEKLFRRAGLNTEYMHELKKSRPETKTEFTALGQEIIESVLLALLTDGSKMSLDDRTLILSAYLDCTWAHVAARFIPYETFDYASSLRAVRQMEHHLLSGDLEEFCLRPSRVSDLKETIREMYDLTDEVMDYISEEQYESTKDIMRGAVRADMWQLFMYLSASGGFYSRRKARVFGDVLGIDVTPEKMRQYIENNDIYTAFFEKKGSILMGLILQIDRGLMENGKAENAHYGERLIDLTERAGEQFLTIDGSMNPDEERDLGSYISGLRSTVEKSVESEE